ncbi:cell division protein SepF [Corynebacterium sp. TA-R-1]|uniref:Cell division protein SepF n=1 Tax=Corynebacterium stercoris TaxID=2943490 RepID=A0ABT1FY65_9CORY|nr:cell division protein SepF [Corynebacterium stercoris]MCP1386710.1 cell division protein SepF [Corynebacterium stercoris]
MSFIGSAKEFFGFGPYEAADDTYYDDQQYREPRETEHAPRTREVHREPRSYTPEIVSTAPRSYNDAKDIGEPFRDGDAVIMDLTDLDAADAKRVVDFAAGLCFALRGSMQNLTKNSGSRRRVFAIIPENARITTSELKHAARLD